MHEAEEVQSSFPHRLHLATAEHAPSKAQNEFRTCNSLAQGGVQLLSLHLTNVQAHFTVTVHISSNVY